MPIAQIATSQLAQYEGMHQYPAGIQLRYRILIPDTQVINLDG